MDSSSKLIGEIGLSHEGSLGMALSLIDACKKSGIDFVKFQHHSAIHESTVDEKFRSDVFPQDKTRFKYWSRTSFTKEEWRVIVDYCSNVGIGFLCTPFSTWSAHQLLEVGCTEVKIGSGDANNWELLKFCKSTFKKIFLSTGMSTKDEIRQAFEFFTGYEGDLIIMQCTSGYPTNLNEVGLSFFDFLQSFVPKIGLSDHSGNEFVPMAAIARGANFVEFHVVFDKDQFGPDSKASLTFEEVSRVSAFRDTWSEVNDLEFDKDATTLKYKEMRQIFGRGLSLKEDLKAGEIVTEDNLTLKKPLGSLGWDDRYSIIGKRTVRDLKSNQHIKRSDIAD